MSCCQVDLRMRPLSIHVMLMVLFWHPRNLKHTVETRRRADDARKTDDGGLAPLFRVTPVSWAEI